MKEQAKNIAIIMAGGVGARFGASIPKQYCELNGRPVIDYVIDAVTDAKNIDDVVVVADKRFVHLSKKLESSTFTFTDNGDTRLLSLESAFNAIKENFPLCERIIILDAVAPFVTGELIDDYISKLDDADAVITCQKITGALGNYDYDPLDRDKFYMTQSPEAFRFKVLMPYFRTDFPSQELAWQMPKETRKYLNFDFKENFKLTYGTDMTEAKIRLLTKEK